MLTQHSLIRARRLCTAAAHHVQLSIYEKVSNKNLAPSQAYEYLVSDGILKPDPRQRSSLSKLDKVYYDILDNKESIESTGHNLRMGLFNNEWLRSWLSPGSSKTINNNNNRSSVLGLYLYGGVGCGKTFLMDLLYSLLPVKSKHRTHFHTFIQEVHNRLHAHRKQNVINGKASVSNAIDMIAADMVKEAGAVYFFDELNVTDIADAMILKQLFSAMIDQGAIFVITSNRIPDDLYKHGLQRELFVPCISLLKDRCIIYDMDSTTDFRLLGTVENETFFVIGEGNDTDEASAVNRKNVSGYLDVIFKSLSNNFPATSMTLLANNRNLTITKAAHGVAEFTFDELCNRPLGSADFLAISRAFHTLILRDIPALHAQRLNEVRRFITLIDVLYDHKVKLICSSVKPVHQIFEVDRSGTSVHDEVFAFDRTVSRLQDIQSEEYKSQPHKPSFGYKSGVSNDLPQDTIDLLQASILTERDIDALWDKYDLNKDNLFNISEVEELLADIYYLKAGHRNVLPQTMDAALSVLKADPNGNVLKSAFTAFCLNSTMWYL